MKRVAVLIAVALACTWAWTKHSKAVNERALATVASRLACKPVHVHCQSWLGQLVDVSDHSGYVQFDRSGRPRAKTSLTWSVCGLLHRFKTNATHPEIDCLLTVDWSRWSYAGDAAGPCEQRAWQTAQAITTLTHESMHMRGWTNEATAQCYAIQEDAWTVMRLGGSLAEGRAVAAFVLARQPGMPGEYQSADCRRGGELDLHPETVDFPTEETPGLPAAPVR